MKVRNGFVSNSSSSSFILAYDESKFTECACCGFTPTSPLERFGEYGHGDSGVLWDNAEERLEKLRQDAHILLDELAELFKQDPRKIIHNYGSYTWTVHDHVESKQEELDFIHGEIADIGNCVHVGWMVIGVSVDDNTNDKEYIQEMREQGFLTVVRGD
jgi:hypothetical protein